MSLDADAATRGGMERHKKLVIAMVTGLWIFGGAFVYYIRISYYFYRDNKESIHDAVSELSQVFGR